MRNAVMKFNQSGFTLIEVMIAAVILAILTAIALPSYQNQMRTNKRTEAENLLLEVASKQQRFFSDQMTYTNDVTALGYTAPLQTESGAYTLTIALGAGGSSYTITATATPDQAKDGCGNLTLTNVGQKGKSGSKSLADCWK